MPVLCVCSHPCVQLCLFTSRVYTSRVRSWYNLYTNPPHLLLFVSFYLNSSFNLLQQTKQPSWSSPSYKSLHSIDNEWSSHSTDHDRSWYSSSSGKSGKSGSSDWGSGKSGKSGGGSSWSSSGKSGKSGGK